MKKVLLAAALAASCGAAMAVEGYVGALIGMGDIKTSCNGISNCSKDDSDTGYKLYGGSSFTPDWSLELGYTNFGKSQAQANGIPQELKAHAFSVVGAYRLNFTRSFAAVGRLGIASVATKLTVNGVEVDDGLKVKPYLGLGIDFTLGKNVKIVTAADVTTASVAGDTARVYLIGAGAEVGF